MMNDLSSSSPPPSGANLNEAVTQMMLAPLVMMCMKLEASINREYETARGIFNNHAKQLDDIYLGHVEKFEGTVRNTMGKICESEQ